MSEDKKIIVDEDWKSQVEAEKEALASGHSRPGEGAASPDDPPMPTASFELLISGLAAEAMMALGQLPLPDGSPAPPRRNQARYLIDLLGVLHQKTAGNLTPDEARAVEDLLHQLRMAFLQLG